LPGGGWRDADHPEQGIEDLGADLRANRRVGDVDAAQLVGHATHGIADALVGLGRVPHAIALHRAALGAEPQELDGQLVLGLHREHLGAFVFALEQGRHRGHSGLGGGT
jgi:hypothetical protein